MIHFTRASQAAARAMACMRRLGIDTRQEPGADPAPTWVLRGTRWQRAGHVRRYATGHISP